MRHATARLVEKVETAQFDPPSETMGRASRITVDIGPDRVAITAVGAEAGGAPLSVEIGDDTPIEINIEGTARVRIRCAGGNVELEARKMTFAALEDIAFEAKNITLRAADRVQLLGKEVDANHHLKVLGD